ncbi:MAG: hypothetical protein IIB95_06455 [Candidatus Marinimicrobia bacterium]|nr:hypothetical protein [Candidatus Neomarinimicrobiota bacterium]
MNSNHMKFTLKIIIMGAFSFQMMWAYPGFGKKINPEMSKSCSQCHVAFPKLRLYGRTIREIGYNVPKTEVEDEGLLKSIYRAIPIGVRGKIDMADTENGKSMLSLVQILSSGTVLNNKVSWWYHKHLYDTEGDKNSKAIDADKFVPFNEGQPHEFWFQYNHSTAINLRFGMFELPFWLSPVKTKIGESEFLCHGASGNPDMAGTLASPQFGFAINGYLPKRASEDDWGADSEENFVEGYNYAFTATNGKAEFPQGFDFLSDQDGSSMTFDTFFARFTKKNASYAAGIWALTGMAEVAPEVAPEDEHGDHAMKTMEMDDNMDSERYYRLGSHIDIFLKGDDINLYGEIVYGNDINRDFLGGMIDYDHLIHPRVLGQIRWSGVFFLNGDAPVKADDGHGDDHGEKEESGGHAHGAMIMDDASFISAGMFYLPLTNIRIGLEYVYQLNGDIGKDIRGRGGKGIFQIQFGF